MYPHLTDRAHYAHDCCCGWVVGGRGQVAMQQPCDTTAMVKLLQEQPVCPALIITMTCPFLIPTLLYIVQALLSWKHHKDDHSVGIGQQRRPVTARNFQECSSP